MDGKPLPSREKLSLKSLKSLEIKLIPLIPKSLEKTSLKSQNPKRKKYPLNPKIPRKNKQKSLEKHKYKKPWKVDKPLTSAVFIAEARDSTMWTVLWTVWTETERTKASPPPSPWRGS